MHIFWMPGVPVIMKIALIPIEVLGMFIKPFALMIRLYANITAGHVVIMSLLGMILSLKTGSRGRRFWIYHIYLCNRTSGRLFTSLYFHVIERPLHR